MSGCGTRIVLRGQKPLALCDRCPCFGSLHPPLAALTFAASSIICAFGLASAAPRSPYRHLELCGIALSGCLPAGKVGAYCGDLLGQVRAVGGMRVKAVDHNTIIPCSRGGMNVLSIAKIERHMAGEIHQISHAHIRNMGRMDQVLPLSARNPARWKYRTAGMPCCTGRSNQCPPVFCRPSGRACQGSAWLPGQWLHAAFPGPARRAGCTARPARPHAGNRCGHPAALRPASRLPAPLHGHAGAQGQASSHAGPLHTGFRQHISPAGYDHHLRLNQPFFRLGPVSKASCATQPV